MKPSTTTLALLIPIALLLSHSQPAEADLQLHWKLDESSGATAADSTANALDGVWQETEGAPAWDPDGGVDGGSVAFSGAGLDSFITTAFSAVTGTPLTISAWVKTSSTGNNGAIYLGNGATGNEYYVVRVQGGVGSANARNQAEIQGNGTTQINDGAWHLVTGVYASSIERLLYVDGVLERTITVDVPEVTLTRFGIGALTRNDPYAPADRFNGEMDDAALWDRAFSPVDAAALNGLGVLGAGNAADLDPLVEAFDSEDTAIISGRNWAFATGLTGAFGDTGGTVAAINAYIVLDDLGNGMRMSTAPGKPVVTTFSATPQTIFLGESTTIAWEVDDADTVEFDQGIGPVDSASGSIELMPTETTTYTLTATNATGSTIPQLTVTVIPNPVVVSFDVTPAYILAGEEATLSWEVQNFTTLEIDQAIGEVTGATGSVVVTPTEDATYTLTATNANGMSTSMASVRVYPARELLLHWPLDEGSGTTTADLAGANPGEFLEVGGSPAWATGLMGAGIIFPNVNDVSVRAMSVLVEEYPFTIAGWVNTTDLGNDTFAVLATGMSGNYYSLRVNGSGNSQMTRRNGTEFSVGGPAVGDGTWHFVVGVFAHPSLRTLYVDGILAGQNETDSGTFQLPDRFAIGALDRTDTSVVDPFGGIVDDVSFWRGVLQESEVLALNNGATGLGLNASDIASLLTGFEAQSSAQAADLTWNFRDDLVGGSGATGGSVGAGDAFIVLDDSGNGMAAQPPNFSIISVVRGTTESVVTWFSRPGAVYTIEFSSDLLTWDEVDDSAHSQGDVTSYPDTDPERVAAPRGYYRVLLLQ